MIMSSPLQRIKRLIPALPIKDIAFADKFFANKDWEALKDLTWSALQRVEAAFSRETVPSKYANIDLDKLRELALECNDYYYLIYPEEEEIEEDDFEEEDNGEEF